VQNVGLRVDDYVRGTSKLAVLVETREETLTSGYSGLASYVVAALPPPNGGGPAASEVSPGEFAWQCDGVPNCEIALNKGSLRGDTSKYYQPISPHGGGPRIWGPSSFHPGVVMHGFGDGRVETINDDIDKTVYVQLSQRNAPKQ
jgi:hypothetical protein